MKRILGLILTFAVIANQFAVTGFANQQSNSNTEVLPPIINGTSNVTPDKGDNVEEQLPKKEESLFAQQGGSETVNTETAFISALERGVSTVTLGGDIELKRPQSGLDEVFIIKNPVTIIGKGHTLSMDYAGMILGDDVTFQNISIYFKNPVRNAIIANGHTLILDNVKNKNPIYSLHLFAGGITNYSGHGSDLSKLPPEAGRHGQIILKNKSEVGNIYAGSLSDVGVTTDEPPKPLPDQPNNFSGDVDITIESNGVGKIGSIYGTGAREYRLGGKPDAMMDDRSLYTVTGNVSLNLKDSKNLDIYPKTGGQKNVSVIYNDTGKGYQSTLNLHEDVNILDVQAGNVKLISLNTYNTSDDINFDEIKIDNGANLEITQLNEKVRTNTFIGGGYLILAPEQTLEIKGNVSNETNIVIGNLQSGHSAVKPKRDHNYIVAPNSIQDSFVLIPHQLDKDAKLVNDGMGNWSVPSNSPVPPQPSTEVLLSKFAIKNKEEQIDIKDFKGQSVIFDGDIEFADKNNKVFANVKITYDVSVDDSTKLYGAVTDDNGIAKIDELNIQFEQYPSDDGTGNDSGAIEVYCIDQNLIKSGKYKIIMSVKAPDKKILTDTVILNITSSGVQTHTHNWSYTANDNVITATCTTTSTPCDIQTATITIDAPTDLEYDGQEKVAIATSSTSEIKVPTVVYKNKDNEILSSAPIKPGVYTASITINNATATVSFEITKKTAPNLTEITQNVYKTETGVKVSNINQTMPSDAGNLSYRVDNIPSGVTDIKFADNNMTFNFSGIGVGDSITIPVIITSEYYLDTMRNVTIIFEDRTIDIKNVKPQNSVYDGNQKVGYTGAPTADGVSADNFVVNYTGILSTNYPTTTNMPKDAGNYHVVFSIKGTDIESTPIAFEITNATPTITWQQNTQSLPLGSDASQIKKPTVVLVNNEKFEGAIDYRYRKHGTDGAFADEFPNTIGKYEVEASISSFKNYNEAKSKTNLILEITKDEIEHNAKAEYVIKYTDSAEQSVDLSETLKNVLGDKFDVNETITNTGIVTVSGSKLKDTSIIGNTFNFKLASDKLEDYNFVDGKYEETVTIKAETQNFKNIKIEVKVMVTQRDKITFDLSKVKVENKVYDGNKIVVIGTPITNGYTGAVTMEVSKGNNVITELPKDVGHYRLRYIVDDHNSYGISDYIDFEITAKPLTFDGSAMKIEKMYDGTKKITNSILGNVVINGIVAREDVTLKYVISKDAEFDTEKPHTANKTIALSNNVAETYLEGKDKSNYIINNYSISNIKMVIKKATPQIKWGEDNKKQNLVYTGEIAKIIPPTVILPTDNYTGTINYSYRVSGSNSAYIDNLPINAGVYEIKASIPESEYYNAAVSDETMTLTVKKAVAPVIPQDISGHFSYDKLHNKFTFTVDKIESAEYSLDSKVWKDSNVFENLEPNTSYTFYVRIKETENVLASAVKSITLTSPKLITKSPMITPNGGKFTSPQNVVIDCKPNTTIYYTLDGSDPSDTTNQNRLSSKTSVTLKVVDSTTVRAIAVDNTAKIPSVESVALFAMNKDKYEDRIKSDDLKDSSLPESLKELGYHSAKQVETALQNAINDKFGNDFAKSFKIQDVKLQYRINTGSLGNEEKWVDATPSHFVNGGITIELPYPKGTSKNTHDFKVAHIFTETSIDDKYKPGDIEYPFVQKTSDKLRFKVNGLSPIMITWTKADSGNDGGNSGGSTGGNGGSDDYEESQKEDDFWKDVENRINEAKSGNTIKINAGKFHKLPVSVMNAILAKPSVKLVIEWNGGKPIVLTSRNALTEKDRIYYPLSYLADLKLDKDFPDYTKPETSESYKPEIPSSNVEESTKPEISESSSSTEESSKPIEETKPESENAQSESSEETITPNKEESKTNNLPMYIAIILVVVLGVSGVLFYLVNKKREH